MYKRRHIEDLVISAAHHFKIVLILGARQVGKSTLLAHLFPLAKTFIFDPVQDLYGVREDPDLFLNNNPSPLILDEVQYVPELLPSLKRKVDQSSEKGQYFLTGSQNLAVLKNVAESLAGRVCIIHLDGMTLYEMSSGAMINNEDLWLPVYLQDPSLLVQRFDSVMPISLFETLWRGSYPGLLEIPNTLVSAFYSSYIQTYIERDVRIVEEIRDITSFERFLKLAAALTAQEINYSQFGRDIGVVPSTAQRWLNVLLNTYQWRELLAFSNNLVKRISKKSKGHLADTGLICYLQRISSHEALMGHPLLGSIFETYVVNTVIRISNALALQLGFYHWRTEGGAEIDLLLEQNGYYYPIEIKCKSNVTKQDARGIKAFIESHSHLRIKTGLIIYSGEKCYWINENVIAFPWQGLLTHGGVKQIIN